ncbi:MAG: FliA/WhiG family RNA polymerase sigma factor [Firmicutes bacterium]|nr:FliA/WhiG family RNA polymerase sigma factor [Bacillota bacterium]
MTQDRENLEQLWHNFKQKQDLEARDRLIDEYIPLVKYLAGRLAINLPSCVEFGDLESFGFFGLLDALEKYDPARNVKFETYASQRIRGAILDGLRASDWVPRSTRSKGRVLENKIQELTNRLGRNPSDEELAAALDLSREAYYEMLDEVKGANLLSLDETVTRDDNGDQFSILEVVADQGDPVDHRLLRQETVRELEIAVAALSEREQLVLSLYYHQELTLKEIGHVLEVSESRISQIHTKAVLTLKQKLKNVERRD